MTNKCNSLYCTAIKNEEAIDNTKLFDISPALKQFGGADGHSVYLPYEELKSLVFNSSLKTSQQYFEWARELDIPDIPRGNLSKIYEKIRCGQRT